ncbi:MAG: N-acetyl-gamma-glutamyl-phosphate reductase [Leptospiraceae bacterium]|nr:N-acetyl-gamma-glutamyl-phosphate reductase [Leptospiraceae bacterium]
MQKKVAIYGAGGLTGRELLARLRYHPNVTVTFISSDAYAGQSAEAVFPQLAYYNHATRDLRFSHHTDPLPSDTDFAFLAVPNASSLELLPRLLDARIPVVDLSGSFRLHNQIVWEEHYKLKHTAFEVMSEVVFGLPEIFRDQIKAARAVANPGCYPTGPILALNALGEYRSQIQSVVVDAKSGVSGAGGRTEDSGFSFQGVHENFRAYKILQHQHQPEILEYAATGMQQPITFPLTFTPHLLPLDRGILATIVVHWQGAAPSDLQEKLSAFCKTEPFLRFYETPEEVMLARVQNTNCVDLALRSRDNITVMVSAIDNLMKGAAGQAIQNMNIMTGFTETAALL